MVLRHLVACGSCGLQYDASELAAGNRFHCGCGEIVEVSEPKPHEAAVVRCSSCGAPRQESVERCSFCHSGFTLHERDLHTICPRCAARISDRAKYCHSCGGGISPQAKAGTPTSFACPACGDGQKLLSRRLGSRDLTILECGRCAGLWLGKDVFAELASHAETVRDAVEALGSGDEPDVVVSIPRIESEPRLYRPCAICETLMHRRNYGRKSGVIIDTCREHGVWFDHGELNQILRWLKAGGSQRARLEFERERREADRQAALYGPSAEPLELSRPQAPITKLVGGIVDFLGYFV